jgi:hypothetical protein
MRTPFDSAPTISSDVRSFAAFVQEAAELVDILYASAHFEDAEDLDSIVTELEELLEDNGDYEDGADLENDLLSKVDQDGGPDVAFADAAAG